MLEGEIQVPWTDQARLLVSPRTAMPWSAGEVRVVLTSWVASLTLRGREEGRGCAGTMTPRRSAPGRAHGRTIWGLTPGR